MKSFDSKQHITTLLPAETVTCPCNLTATDLVDFMENEFPFWAIHEFERKLIYGFGNGVILTAMQPKLAAQIHETLQPVNTLLFQLIDRIEADYEEAVNKANPASVVYLEVFRSVIYEISTGLKLWSKEEELQVDEPAWIGFSICLGIIAQQRGLRIAERQIKHFTHAKDSANQFLFLRIVHWAEQSADRLTPMDRYLAYCYRFTRLEGPHLAKFLARFTRHYLAQGEAVETNRLFHDFHQAGRHDAKHRPQFLRELIDDINTHLGESCSKQNAELFQKHIGPSPSDWSKEQVWEGGLSLVREQSPHLLNLKCTAARIHEIALSQRLLDFAYWSGLYAEASEAFKS